MASDIKVPEMGESITEATIINWTKNEGDSVEIDEVLAELETDKVTMEVRAPSAGVLSKIAKVAGDVVKVAEIIGKIEAGSGAKTAGKQEAKTQETSSQATAQASSQAASASPSNSANANDTIPPAAMKLIQENNLRIADIKGTGRNGQITKEDVVLYLEKKPAASQTSNPVITQQIASKPRGSEPREKVVPMSKLRQTIANRLVQAQATAAILTTFNEVDMFNLMNLRSTYKDKFKETHNVGLGFMSFFTKACIQALKFVPEINAEIKGTDVIYKNYYDIGVAVGGPKGLVVPIVRDADLLSLAQIELEIARLAGKVKEGKISLEEMEGGTFTISNGGVYGSLMSTPIINPPQSGILGMHNIVKRPVVVNDEIVIRPMMYIALSYDHRIVDGKGAVTFLVKLKEMIEDPARMLLEI
ncbi:2-oxoglutarate dehydrogenase complex dihydrolipoyllysine-residue succinyltransferase [Leptospira sp. GIMC2001]|uniref:2-oxoglutarate dehydrogenase complex dihydrolipoyllysine-residue succinyltransferase n=1 Tax=Leptospira sp. GIMC2001 TaxID=1513297 RepID=UPI00234B11C7|nr:2-oxoglutarate dehydrogenase complex dihydrolipoyllysine-residue succinyltransferase [Leptospira sp. GIMC2001]WCL50616.1 2-oxoglutarate dehydrogenase complex dihydrolipoyllysine-residue succinyltransferase [Leptospira sp. GIMC2001]